MEAESKITRKQLESMPYYEHNPIKFEHIIKIVFWRMKTGFSCTKDSGQSMRSRISNAIDDLNPLKLLAYFVKGSTFVIGTLAFWSAAQSSFMRSGVNSTNIFVPEGLSSLLIVGFLYLCYSTKTNIVELIIYPLLKLIAYPLGWFSIAMIVSDHVISFEFWKLFSFNANSLIFVVVASYPLSIIYLCNKVSDRASYSREDYWSRKLYEVRELESEVKEKRDQDYRWRKYTGA